jgi:hypothetical protein
MTHRSSLSKRRLHSLLLLGALVIFVVIPISTWRYFRPPCPASSRSPICGPAINDLEVEITSPEECSLNLPAGKHIPVEGTYSGNLAGREIWVLTYASDQKYYPQLAVELPHDQIGRWSTSLFDLTAEQLDIVVTVADENSEASQDFNDWLSTGGVRGGYSKLPDGLTEMHAITVRTQKCLVILDIRLCGLPAAGRLLGHEDVPY